MTPHEYRVRLVGGVFSDGEPRPSGYFRQLADDLSRRLSPRAIAEVHNGGSMADLDAIIDAERATPSSAVLWMADVPNVEAKRLPLIYLIWHSHGTILVQSKNNDGRRYTDAQLVERMRASRAEALLELMRTPAGVQGVIHHAAGRRSERTPKITEVADELARVLVPAPLQFPLSQNVRRTVNEMSWKGMDFSIATEIPLWRRHPGSFGVERKHHRHEGVDLYAAERSAVAAMEAGTVVAIECFTGPEAGSPWWLPTDCVMVAGDSGVLNYGEIKPARALKVGDRVEAGEVLGQVATVLREDKGRPRSMLHFERYVHGTTTPLAAWALDEEQPAQLLDPTGLLIRAARAHS